MLKDILILGLLLIGLACNRKDKLSDNLKESVLETENEEDYTALIPFDTLEDALVYQVNGFKIIMKDSWRIQNSQGPDFVVSSFLSSTKNRFHCYFGYHPSYPSPINWQSEGLIVEPSVKDSLEKYGAYFEKILAYIDDGIKQDLSTKYRRDSMILQVQRLPTKDIWIRKPFIPSFGPIDIGIIFKSDTINEKIHIFGECKNSIEAEKLIQIAKSIEKM